MQHRNFVVYKHSIKTINSLPFWCDKQTVVPRSHFPRNTKKKELLGLVQQVVFWTNLPTQHCHVEVNWIEDSTSFWAYVTRNEDLAQGDFLIFFPPLATQPFGESKKSNPIALILNIPSMVPTMCFWGCWMWTRDGIQLYNPPILEKSVKSSAHIGPVGPVGHVGPCGPGTPRWEDGLLGLLLRCLVVAPLGLWQAVHVLVELFFPQNNGSILQWLQGLADVEKSTEVLYS